LTRKKKNNPSPYAVWDKLASSAVNWKTIKTTFSRLNTPTPSHLSKVKQNLAELPILID
jgi:hypothetical protein